MAESTELLEALEAHAERRAERRDFFKTFGIAIALGGGLALAVKGNPANAQTAPTDADVLNFALNLEYLEANFYSYAVNGTPIAATMTTGTGTPGAAVGGRAVTFSDPIVAALAREIAADEIAHVNFLRTQLGAAAVAQPSIDVGSTPTSAFSMAAQAAGVVPAGTAFDPYADDVSFLTGAFIFEDVGVTAYKGASPLITNKTYLEAAAGILGVEAYHAAAIRETLYTKGVATPATTASSMIIPNIGKISDARDSLDGPTDDDQGIAPIGSASNIVPADSNAIAYSRSTGQVLNIVYLNKASVTSGGFFPAGVNGNIRASAANG